MEKLDKLIMKKIKKESKDQRDLMLKINNKKNNKN